MLFGSLDGRGVWGRVNTCICMIESLYCPPATITTLLIGYTPMQKKKKKLNKNVNTIMPYSCLKLFLRFFIALTPQQGPQSTHCSSYLAAHWNHSENFNRILMPRPHSQRFWCNQPRLGLGSWVFANFSESSPVRPGLRTSDPELHHLMWYGSLLIHVPLCTWNVAGLNIDTLWL